jgi:predicted transcriptional regulator
MEILEYAINGEKKTNIMYKAHLSFGQLERYLSALRNVDLITERSGVWKTTQKGFHVIKACKICQSLMNESF